MGTGLVTAVLGLQSSSPEVITNMPPNHSATILMDGESPNFVVELPALRLVSPIAATPPGTLNPLVMNDNLGVIGCNGANVNIKPSSGSAMMSFLKPVIRNFWPLWEGSGVAAADIVGGNNAEMALDGNSASELVWNNFINRAPFNSDLSWPLTPQPSVARQPASFGNWETHPAWATLDPLIDLQLSTPITLTGSWAIDFCWRVPYSYSGPEVFGFGSSHMAPDANATFAYQWTHCTITNDPVNGIQGYINGFPSSKFLNAIGGAALNSYNLGAYYLLNGDSLYVPNTTPLTQGVYQSSFTITGLFQALGYLNGGCIELEYFRIWRRPLNLIEIQSLAADPFCMFGVTQEMLDEITNIIQFMTPTKEDWFFVFTS